MLEHCNKCKISAPCGHEYDPHEEPPCANAIILIESNNFCDYCIEHEKCGGIDDNKPHCFHGRELYIRPKESTFKKGG